MRVGAFGWPSSTPRMTERSESTGWTKNTPSVSASPSRERSATEKSLRGFDRNLGAVAVDAVAGLEAIGLQPLDDHVGRRIDRDAAQHEQARLRPSRRRRAPRLAALRPTRPGRSARPRG